MEAKVAEDTHKTPVACFDLAQGRIVSMWVSPARDGGKGARTCTRHTWAEGRQPTGAAVDSARQNLASSFVNGFINAGFGHDKLVTAPTEGQVCLGGGNGRQGHFQIVVLVCSNAVFVLRMCRVVTMRACTSRVARQDFA
eukprot:1151822-Pelagomonas_calceolata.AAC.4